MFLQWHFMGAAHCTGLIHRQTSVENAIEYFINDPGGQRDQYQVRTRLLPFVTSIVRQPANQPAIEFLGDARRKLLTARQVLLNTGWQGRPGVPVVAMFANNVEDVRAIDAWTMIAAA